MITDDMKKGRKVAVSTWDRTHLVYEGRDGNAWAYTRSWRCWGPVAAFIKRVEKGELNFELLDEGE